MIEPRGTINVQRSQIDEYLCVPGPYIHSFPLAIQVTSRRLSTSILQMSCQQCPSLLLLLLLFHLHQPQHRNAEWTDGHVVSCYAAHILDAQTFNWVNKRKVFGIKMGNNFTCQLRVAEITWSHSKKNSHTLALVTSRGNALYRLEEAWMLQKPIWPRSQTHELQQRKGCFEGGQTWRAFERFLVAAKPTTLVEVNVLSSFFCQCSKGGQNSPSKHGSMCSLSHKFRSEARSDLRGCFEAVVASGAVKRVHNI